MKKTKNNNRRDFLMNVCPTVAMAFLGITVLDSCSSGDDDSDYGNGSNNNNNNNNGNGNSTGTGYTVSGSTTTIDLNHAMFSTLQSNNWINFTAQNMLILKISSTSYRAFTNACPHQGVRNRWSYSNNQFRCSQHGNSYATDCETAGNGGKLECYTTSLNDSTLTVTK
jgi:nitrite reductase/ring-hydroxylating ferredoxin subunit